MEAKNLKQSINRLCEFSDNVLEQEYFSSDIKRAMKYIKPVILLLGILNTLFIIPDYLFIKNVDGFTLALTSRLVFLILVLIFYFCINRIKSSRIISYVITGYEIAGLLIFLLVFYQYKSPNFLIQAFGVIVLILAVFLVPNRWIHMIIVSVFVGSGFLLVSLHYLPDLNFSEFSAGAVYMAIVIVLSSISASRTNYYKRTHYINNKELLQLSATDPLTGIYNRGKLYEEFHFLVDCSKRYNIPLSFAIFDFDDFKNINDTYGHLTGDKVIVASISLIKSVIRKTDVFARWGGDEFVILLPHTSKDHAIELIERIRLIIANHNYDKVGKVTCSFGIVSLDNPDQDLEAIFHCADELLYSAKKSGKNAIKY